MAQETVAAMLAAWRERGLQQRDPVPYHRLQALARRAEAHGGRTRELLDQKLAALLAHCAARLAADQTADQTADQRADQRVDLATGLAADLATDRAASPPRPAIAGPLADLARQLAGAPATPLPVVAPSGAAAPGHAGPAAPAAPAAPVELKALRQHRRTWSRLHVERRLSQSKAQAPDQAGPLHSQALVLRTLDLMRELSPEYLEHFIAQVDTLLWLEDAHGGSALLQKDVLRSAADAAPPARARKGSRKRAAE